MSEKYTIKEISELFNIPKSTLRYWESEGLISSLRNNSNNYREYCTDSLIKICDIIFYRNLNIPVKDVSKTWKMSVSDTEELLLNSKDKLEQQITELESIKYKIDQNLEGIKTYNELKDNPYRNGIPPFTSIVHLHLGQTKNVLNYINNQNILAFPLHLGDKEIKHYGVVSNNIDSSNGKILWSCDNKKHEYIECLIRTEGEEVDQVYLQDHLDYIKSIGKNCGIILSKYLISDKSYDYYHSWIETL
ncbi:MerR family DNA-binding transcriptional regulator [[Clostridium] dakarense]|uniref:MerR family DNA-binding transcriptional regulator n=1 Tax=Faecalimicrobium dakarense TaxID=1301100 RepID=UPI0004B83E0B|nr:MerR family DNA-binding transcriptional regulator [[Clostridium] dakarense]